ncbi:MAG: class I SAM-dependent methyltransferase [Phycisphaerales bacterium]|nr:class I SAM-dependent methyltransferase [Phycisphaerales bacterium]
MSAKGRSGYPYVRKFLTQGPVLDVGCAVGEELETFPAGSFGLDGAQEFVQICKDKGLNVAQADFNERLPIDDEKFDTVFCSHVMEHVESPYRLLRDFRRILRGGGARCARPAARKRSDGLATEVLRRPSLPPLRVHAAQRASFAQNDRVRAGRRLVRLPEQTEVRDRLAERAGAGVNATGSRLLGRRQEDGRRRGESAAVLERSARRSVGALRPDLGPPSVEASPSRGNRPGTRFSNATRGRQCR